MLKIGSIIFFCLAVVFNINAQKLGIVPSLVLVLDNEVVDTLIITDSTERFFMVQASNSVLAPRKIKKDEAFKSLTPENNSLWVKFRYEDDFLVDDIFIPAKVLGYNDTRLLLDYEYNNMETIASVHKSQIAVKDLKKFESAIQSSNAK